MRKRGRYWRRFSSAIALVAVAFLSACSKAPRRLRIGETFAMGEFRLAVQSVTVLDRRHQGVPVDVEIRLTCYGGNRFQRMDLANALSRKSPAYFTTNGGWRERLFFSTSGEQGTILLAHVYPPVGSRGYVLTLVNTYGQREHIEVDLGR